MIILFNFFKKKKERKVLKKVVQVSGAKFDQISPTHSLFCVILLAGKQTSVTEKVALPQLCCSKALLSPEYKKGKGLKQYKSDTGALL